MKKSKLFLTGMAALLLSFGLVLAGCPTDPDEETTDAATPVINVQPQDATYGDGDTADSLTVSASVTDGGTLSYQWYSNTADSVTGGSAISGAANASYTPPITANGTVYYYVIVTNTNDSATGAKTAIVTSAVATVEKVSGTLVHAETPSITAQPAGATYTAGATATALSVTANVTDGGTLSYQWYSNTANSATGGSVISGATQLAYTPPVTAAGTVYYYVIVTNTNNEADGTKVKTETSNVAAITVTGGSGGGGGALTWTLVDDSTFDSIDDIAYGGGRFVVVGEDNEYNKVAAYSEDDGETWTAVTDVSALPSTIYDITYGDGKFVVVSSDGQAAYSEDGGETWTAVTVGESYNDIYSIAYGGGRFVAVGRDPNGGYAAYSEDLETWTAGQGIDQSYLRNFDAIAYGGTPGEEKFVAMSNTFTQVYSEDGGETWTASEDYAGPFNAIAYGGGKFVAVGGSGRAEYFADDEVSWTLISGDYDGSILGLGSNGVTGLSINGITYGGGKFVAWGGSGRAAYSEDGVSWTAIEDGSILGSNSSNSPYSIYGIAYGGGKFVAVGSDGRMAYSNAQE